MLICALEILNIIIIIIIIIILMLILFERKKKRFPTKSIHQISISDMRMLLLTGKIGKAY